MRNNKSNKGFTLIELLIVIAIIGILAAVLIPNLLSARGRAQDTSAQACARELLTQAEMYNIDEFTYEGFDGTGDYETNACADTQVAGFEITTATAQEIAGNVTSLSDNVYEFSNADGVSAQD